MGWIINQLRDHPKLAIFLILSAGFWLDRFRTGKFSLETVTSILLVEVLVGQLNISINGPMRAVFFLLFLFAVGYKVGPQFFRKLKKGGLPQVGFTVLMCTVSLIAPWILAKIVGYHVGEATGLLAGSQTISAVTSVADDTINQLSISDAQRATFINATPVAYAMTYIFGTAGSTWVLASLGPRILGELEKVKVDCKGLKAEIGTSETDEPGFYTALRPVVSRVCKIDSEWFGRRKTVNGLENYLVKNDKRLFVERIWQKGVIEEVTPDMLLQPGDEVVLSGRREHAIGGEDWVGPEATDAQLLDFPAEMLPVMVTHHTFAGEKVSTIRALKFMHGVSIRSIKQADIDAPVLAQTVIDSGDILELTGTKLEIETATRQMGYTDRPTDQTDIILVGLGILLDGLVDTLAIHLGDIPISLSTSEDALIAGLVFNWLRSKHPTFGGIPEPSLWALNNVGLNMFITVVGIAAGPSFMTGFKEVRFSLPIVGALATATLLLSGLLMGRHLFRFHPALALGCTARARTTAAALGATQDALESNVPMLGYTMAYTVGSTLLVIWGVAIVLPM